MVVIKIEKPKEEMKEALDVVHFSLAVEDSIGKYAITSSGPYKQHGSLRDLQSGVLGLETYVFGTKIGGVIEYRQFTTTLGYYAHIELKGFRKNNRDFKKLKRRLEAIATAKDPAPFLEDVKQHKNIRMLGAGEYVDELARIKLND